MAPLRFATLLTLVSRLCCCYGNADLTSQIITLEELPHGLEGYGPVKFVVRSIYKSDIEFIPSKKFRVLINATVGPGEDLTELQYSLEEQRGAAVLEIYKEEKVVLASPLYFISVTIDAAAAIAFVFAIVFVCWWNKQKRPHLKEHKFQYRDSSRAPLLAARSNRTERPNKNGNHSVPPESRLCREEQIKITYQSPNIADRYSNGGDSNKWDATKPSVDTERDTLPRPTRTPGQGHAMMHDIPQTGSNESPSNTLEREGSQQRKPVIAHIKMDEPYSVKPKIKPKKKAKQYVPLETVDTPDSDVHNHPTLKIRGGAGSMLSGVDQEIPGPPVDKRPKKKKVPTATLR